MLVLSRRKNEKIRIGHDVVVTVVRTGRHEVRIGIDAPEGVQVHREEIYQAIHRESGVDE